MKKEDGKFVWSMDAKTIERMVRGFQPFPTTFTYLEGKKLTLWKARAESGSGPAEPGTVMLAEADDLRIACGVGTSLRISELQLEGKRRMGVRDFLNGIKLRAGEVISE